MLNVFSATPNTLHGLQRRLCQLVCAAAMAVCALPVWAQEAGALPNEVPQKTVDTADKNKPSSKVAHAQQQMQQSLQKTQQAQQPVRLMDRHKSVGSSITDVRFNMSDEGVRMSGNVQLTLPDTLLQTLQRGAPVYFLFETQTTRSRWYWSDKDLATNRRYVRLVFQPLTQRWRVNVSSEPFRRGSVGVTLNQNYRTLDAALAAVRRISGWHVLSKDAWSEDSDYTVQARFRVDVPQLGQPFQSNVGWMGGNLDTERTLKLTAHSLTKDKAQ